MLILQGHTQDKGNISKAIPLQVERLLLEVEEFLN